jgi:hypothetical protein
MMEEMNGAPDEEDDINNEINLLTGIEVRVARWFVVERVEDMA